MKYVLGLDVGSSSAKAGLFSQDGQLVGTWSRRYPTMERQVGWKEQDPECWWTAVCELTQEATSQGRSKDVLAVGATGHISSLTFVDAQGRPLRPAIGFQDQRAVEEVGELYSQFTRADLAAEMGIDLPPAATWPLPRLLWFLKNEPAVLDRAHRVLQAKDFVNFRLTGEFCSDLSSNRGMVSFDEGRVAARVFEKLKLPKHIVPRLAEPHEVVGCVTRAAAEQTGLPAGVPVVAGWNDLNACVLGSGAVDEGQLFNVTGTSEHIGVVAAGNHLSDQLVCAPFLAGKRLLYGVTLCGGGSLDWFQTAFGCEFRDLLAEAGRATEGAGGLLFLPYLEGERAPIWDPHASAAFIGIRLNDRRGHFVRAVLEGVAFSLRQILDLVVRQYPGAHAPVVVCGGAARAALWNQIKASVLDREVVVPSNIHAGIMGAALLATVGAGLHPDPESAARALVKMGEAYSPEPAASRRYREMFAMYTDLYPALADIFSRIYKFRQENQKELCPTSRQ